MSDPLKIDCQSAQEALEELKVIDRDILQAHLDHCPGCRQVSLFNRRLASAGEVLPMVPVPADLHSKVMQATGMKAGNEATLTILEPIDSSSDSAGISANIGLMISFLVFAAIMFTIEESVWNLLSWALSLGLLLLLKPVFESPASAAAEAK